MVMIIIIGIVITIVSSFNIVLWSFSAWLMTVLDLTVECLCFARTRDTMRLPEGLILQCMMTTAMHFERAFDGKPETGGCCSQGLGCGSPSSSLHICFRDFMHRRQIGIFPFPSIALALPSPFSLHENAYVTPTRLDLALEPFLERYLVGCRRTSE